MFFKKQLQTVFLQLFILQSNFQITLAFLLDTTKFLTQVDFYWAPRFLPANLHKFFWNATGILLELHKNASVWHENKVEKLINTNYKFAVYVTRQLEMLM